MYPFSWTHITDRGFTLFKLNLFSLSVEIVSYCRLISVDVINEFRLNWCRVYGVVEERFREPIESVRRRYGLHKLPMCLYRLPIGEGKGRSLSALGGCDGPVIKDYIGYSVAEHRLVLKLDSRSRPYSE